jgi:muramoyltetrapeptide carboxypeptidase
MVPEAQHESVGKERGQTNGVERWNPAVAVFSPSSSTVPFPRRRARALAELKYRFSEVYVGACWDINVRGQAGTAEQRAAEVTALATMPERPMLMASTGGLSCNEILQHLDFGLLNELQPVVCGFSDTSTLLLALHAKTGVRCLHGPAVLPCYGEFGGIDPYTHEHLLRAVSGPQSPLVLQPPAVVATRVADWDRSDDQREARMPSGGWKSICPGVAEGPAIVANLEVLEGLLATPYLPPLGGSVLIVEEAAGPIERTFRRLEHLAQAKQLAGLSALVFGRLPDGCDPEDRRYEVLRQIGGRYGFPVLADFDIGHTEPKVTVPLGAIVRLDSDGGSLVVEPVHL